MARVTQTPGGDRPYNGLGVYGTDVAPIAPLSTTQPQPPAVPTRTLSPGGAMVIIVALVLLVATVGYLTIAELTRPVGTSDWMTAGPMPTAAATPSSAEPHPTVPVTVPSSTARPSASTTPFSTRTISTPPQTRLCRQTTANTSQWSTVSPAGWCVEKVAEQQLYVSGPDDMLIASMPAASIPELVAICGLTVSTDTEILLPDTMWGGLKAKTVDLVTADLHAQVRCVTAPHGYVQAMWIDDEGTGSHATITAAMDALTASWKWR